MNSYDPNVRWAMKKIEIYLQRWDYTATAQVEIGGNTVGSSLLEGATDSWLDRLFEGAEDDRDLPPLILKNPKGEELQIVLDPDDEQELKDLVVGLRIVEVIPDSKRTSKKGA